MNKNEIIESGILESYVLGATTPSENSMIQDACKQFPELLQEIESIEMALMQYSENSVPFNPNSAKQIKTDILAQIKTSSSNKVPKIILLNTAYYKLGIAASVLLLSLSIIFNIVYHNQLNSTRAELTSLNKEKENLNEALASQRNDMNAINEKMEILTNPSTKNITLNGMNSLAAKKAMVHFNPITKEVYFNARDLEITDGNKQYQLWAIVNGKPVDMGVIDLTNKTIFQKMKTIENAQAFAVTIEKKGGNPTPSLETMCFLGNV